MQSLVEYLVKSLVRDVCTSSTSWFINHTEGIDYCA